MFSFPLVSRPVAPLTGGAAAAPVCGDPFGAGAAGSSRAAAGSFHAAAAQPEAAPEPVSEPAAQCAAAGLAQGSRDRWQQCSGG